MDLEKVRIIVEEAIRQADLFRWWLYLILIVIAGAASFLGAYLRRKGEHIATKEDIAEITRKIEQVRFEFSKSMEEVLQQNRIVLEKFKTRHQLRLAALNRRLEVHQEAFTLWRKLLSSVHDEERIGSVVMECQDWWDENCLYLEPDARQAFNNCYRAAFLHRDLLKGIRNLKDINENWSRVMEAGKVIIKAVELPAIKDLETEVLKLDENQKA
jgi:hypothetical protein